MKKYIESDGCVEDKDKLTAMVEFYERWCMCKDCIHWDGKDGQCPVQSTSDPEYDQTPKPDWFCADGERRTDATN